MSSIQTMSQRFAPTTGQTITIANADAGLVSVIVDPSGSLLALTVNMPTNPFDGQCIMIGTSNTITTLTLGGNGNTLLGTITTLAANGWVHFSYNTSQAKWYRMG